MRKMQTQEEYDNDPDNYWRSFDVMIRTPEQMRKFRAFCADAGVEIDERWFGDH